MPRLSISRLVPRRFVAELGQSTAEYALVILGACALATLLISWATGSHAISKLFDSVITKVMPG
jgi:hypothetical protein